jgi:aminoglycoside 3-N-acetyltransferase
VAQALPVTRDDIAEGLAELGVRKRSLLMVHSSLSAIGEVDGGAEAVVDGLLDVLGPGGTLVVPAFTFTTPSVYFEARDANWIFDPVETPSEMGAITNTVRNRPGARRSIHLWYSVTALGPLADRITTAGGTSAWDAESPMAWVLRNGGWLLLLGVPYQNLTAIHIWEVEFGVDYRVDYDVERPMRQPDGSLITLVSRVHAPVETHPGGDFNRFGERLEAAGNVHIGHVGNAVARLFSSGDAYPIAKAMYDSDARSFLKQTDPVTSLTYGHTIQNMKGTQCVVDPDCAFPT